MKTCSNPLHRNSPGSCAKYGVGCALHHGLSRSAAHTCMHVRALRRKDILKSGASRFEIWRRYRCSYARFQPRLHRFSAALTDSYLPGVALVGETMMGTPQDHRKCAEECVAMARAADDRNDKALWLTLAQSWVRLAEHVARAGHPERSADEGREDVLAAHSSD